MTPEARERWLAECLAADEKMNIPPGFSSYSEYLEKKNEYQREYRAKKKKAIKEAGTSKTAQ
jgi:hypothetical protein